MKRPNIKNEAKKYDKSCHCGHTSGEDPSYHYLNGAYSMLKYVDDLERKQKQILDLLLRAKEKHIPYHSKLWEEISELKE